VGAQPGVARALKSLHSNASAYLSLRSCFLSVLAGHAIAVACAFSASASLCACSGAGHGIAGTGAGGCGDLRGSKGLSLIGSVCLEAAFKEARSNRGPVACGSGLV